MPSSLTLAVALAAVLTVVAPADAATTTNVTGARTPDGSDPFADISADGRFVAYDALNGPECRQTLTDLNPPGCVTQVYVYDTKTKKSELVSRTASGAPGNAASRRPTISADGRYVAFVSAATNIAKPAKGTETPIFVFDRKTRKLTRIKLAKGARLDEARFYAPRISPDGSVVVIDPNADLSTGKLVFTEGGPLYAVWWRTGKYVPVTVGADGRLGTANSEDHGISRDGRYVAFSTALPLSPADTDTTADVYVRDIVARKTIPVTATIPMTCTPVDTATDQCRMTYAQHRLDASGRMAAFYAVGATQGTSQARYRIGVRDLKTGQVRFKATDEFVPVTAPALSIPNVLQVWLSGDGKHVHFVIGNDAGQHGYSNSLWHWDLGKDTVTRMAGGSMHGGAVGNFLFDRPSSTHDGKRVAFLSTARLTPDDTDDFDDVFVLS